MHFHGQKPNFPFTDVMFSNLMAKHVEVFPQLEPSDTICNLSGECVTQFDQFGISKQSTFFKETTIVSFKSKT